MLPEFPYQILTESLNHPAKGGQLQNKKGERAIGARSSGPNGSFALFILKLASLEDSAKEVRKSHGDHSDRLLIRKQ
jgi:hypothetical protein